MTDWTEFPTFQLGPRIDLWRIHNLNKNPAFFNPSDAWRFGPLPTHRGKFGVCYLGLGESIPAYVEKYGRFGVITTTQRAQDGLSELTVARTMALADLTHRSVLGNFGINASHSVGGDYRLSQRLAAQLFDAGFDGIRYRINHDPRLELEAVALFGEPGEHPERFNPPKTINPIPDALVAVGHEFGIIEVPTAALP